MDDETVHVGSSDAADDLEQLEPSLVAPPRTEQSLASEAALVPRRSMGPLATVLVALVTVLGLAATLLSWSLASPLSSGPDEPNHVVAAAAAVVGHNTGLVAHFPFGTLSIVDVPRWAAQAHLLVCYARMPWHLANCGFRLSDATHLSRGVTQFATYPQLYYLVVGQAAQFTAGVAGFWGMRLISMAMVVALLALGLLAIVVRGRARLRPLGFLVACTPYLYFICAVLNSSALEVAAALASWCCLLVLIDDPNPPGWMIWSSATSLALFMLARPASPLLVVIVLLVAACYAGWTRCRALVRWRFAPIAVAVGLSGITAVIWRLWKGSPVLLGRPWPHHLTLLQAADRSLGLSGPRLRDLVGRFGWLDTPVHLWVVIGWATVLGVLVVLGMASSGKARRGVPVAIIATIVLPVLIEAPLLNHVGTIWQARYSLPVAVGVPLVAATRLGRRLEPRRRIVALGTLVAGTTLGVLQLQSLRLVLERYRTGLGLAPGAPVRWNPPGGAGLTIGLLVVGQCLLVAVAVFASLQRRSGRPSAVPTSTEEGNALEVNPAQPVAIVSG